MTARPDIDHPCLPDRFATFQDFWDLHQPTARQLAAIGHVYDRPPLEAIEEGSRCVVCSHFVKREDSIRALEGPLHDHRCGGYSQNFDGFNFHSPGCKMLQTRLPLEPQSIFPGLSGGSKMHDLRRHWEKKSHPPRASEPAPQRSQTSSLFSLPTELRLEIYARVLPNLDQTTEIVPLNQDSARVTTKVGHEKTGPRDLIKCNVLRVCKAVHNEALDLLYHNITYRFAATKTLYLFLRHIGSRGRQLLKSIDVLCGSREDAITFSLLATCEKLRSIRIRLPRPMILWPGAPIWSIDGMGALLMLSGLEEVKFGDCGPRFKTCMDEDKSDAAVLRRELTRPKQEPSRVRWVNYWLDI